MGIKSQAKNEVGDLLSVCVVDPLDNRIQTALGQSEKALGEAVGQRTQSVEKNLSGQIGVLRTLVEKKVKKLSDVLEDEIPDAIQDCRNGIHRDISDLTETVETGLTELKQALSNTEKNLEAAVSEELSLAIQDITQNINASAESAGQDIAKLEAELNTLKIQLEEADGRLSLASQATEEKLKELSQKVDSGFAQSSQASEEKLMGLAKSIDVRISESTQTVERELVKLKSVDENARAEANRRIDDLAEALECGHRQVMEYQGEMRAELDRYKSEAEKHAEKQYKTLLATSLIVGATNLLGIVALALICLF